MLDILASVVLATLAGLINAWAAARYGRTEKRYLIGGAASLAGIGILLVYEALTHRWRYTTGLYIPILFIVQWLAGLRK
jgi:hypothetical protein